MIEGIRRSTDETFSLGQPKEEVWPRGNTWPKTRLIGKSPRSTMLCVVVHSALLFACSPLSFLTSRRLSVKSNAFCIILHLIQCNCIGLNTLSLEGVDLSPVTISAFSLRGDRGYHGTLGGDSSKKGFLKQTCLDRFASRTYVLEGQSQPTTWWHFGSVHRLNRSTFF